MGLSRIKERPLHWSYFQSVDKFLNSQLLAKLDSFLERSKEPLHSVWENKRSVVLYVREVLKSLASQVKNAYFPFYRRFQFDNRELEKKSVGKQS